LLIAGGAAVNMKDTRGNTALRWVMGGKEVEKEKIRQILKNAGVKE